MYALDSVRSFTVLSDKPGRIERYCRPEYKSADPN